jgi:ABC-type uncharacterized transport system permease subunit
VSAEDVVLVDVGVVLFALTVVAGEAFVAVGFQDQADEKRD